MTKSAMGCFGRLNRRGVLTLIGIATASGPALADIGNVYVFDAITYNRVCGPIGVGAHPEAMAVQPGTPIAYVTNDGSDDVDIINLQTCSPVPPEPIFDGIGSHPQGVAFTPSGDRAFVANNGSGTVSVIDTASHTVTQVIPAVGDGPYGVAVHPDGSRAYVTNTNSGDVAVIDITNPSYPIVGRIATGRRPLVIAITPGGDRAYVATNEFTRPDDPSKVFVIDTQLGQVTRVIDVQFGAEGVAITPPNPNSIRVYVTNEVGTGQYSVQGGSISEIDEATPTVFNIDEGPCTAPEKDAVRFDATHLAVANELSHNVVIYDIDPTSLTYRQPLYTLDGVGVAPEGIAYTEAAFNLFAVVDENALSRCLPIP